MSLAHVGADAAVWGRGAPGLFDVAVDNGHAKGAITTYAAQIKVTGGGGTSRAGCRCGGIPCACTRCRRQARAGGQFR